MKKFIVFMTSIIMMMIIVASPLTALKTHAEVNFTNPLVDVCTDITTGSSGYKIMPLSSAFNTVGNSDTIAQCYAIYWYGKLKNSNEHWTVRVLFESADVTFENNVLTVTNAQGLVGKWYDGNTDRSIGTMNSLYFDFANRVFRFQNNGATASETSYFQNYELSEICVVKSNIPEFLQANGLDLNVSFTYPMSGEMTRKKTGETGITTTTDGNLMYVNNRGADAQFCMAIIPKGESLSFNTWAYTGRDNIIGNPTFVYICDEWQSFGVLSSINIADSSASANSIYAPSAWHTVEEGASRTYYLAWESMKLQKNTEYDCVVYGCLNEDMEEMSGFYYDNYNLGSTYTVSGTINDVQEVYRSTFTIKDPATFNPNYKNEHDSSHPWDPDSDNADLFSTGSAYKDENGNVVIKGFKTGTSGLSWETGSSSSSYSGNNLNVNNAFGGFFGFFRNILSFLPNEYTLIIFFGVVGMVAIGIIKAVK